MMRGIDFLGVRFYVLRGVCGVVGIGFLVRSGYRGVVG
jgi:hypothetical protein